MTALPADGKDMTPAARAQMTNSPVGISPVRTSPRPGWRWETPGSARRWVLDIALAVGATYAAVILTDEAVGTFLGRPSITATILAVVYGGAIAFRRVAPRIVLVGQALAAVAYAIVGLPVYMLGPAVLVTVYTVAARLERRASLAMLAFVEVALTLALWLGPSSPAVVSQFVQYAAILAGTWFLGDVVRRWQTAAAAHSRRAAELEQAREELARLAVTDERLRIARELHDVVAHSMSVIAMHAGSGRVAVDRDPAATRRALVVIERSSRDALAEIRRLVAVLRAADDNATMLTPAPGLPDIHSLVAEVAAAGVTVDVQTVGDLAAVPSGVSLAAYRIVQEAMTNVVRHAAPTRARLCVLVGDGQVEIEVANDATGGVRTPGSGEGHGTIGMRERAALYGGEFTAGPQPDGGWRVTARLPYQAAEQ
jgi:signal transduction histidine kinase